MKDSFLGRETESHQKGLASHLRYQPWQKAGLLSAPHNPARPRAWPCLWGQHPAPHPSKERSVELIWKIHRVLLQETCWGEAAPLSSPQSAVLHRASLEPEKGAACHCQKPKPQAQAGRPQLAHREPKYGAGSRLCVEAQQICCVTPSW